AELWPRVSRAITYFESFDIADGGLVPADPRYWLFLDWTDGLPRTGCPTLLNMMLLEALESAADLAEIVRPGGASDRVRPLAETLRRTIETRLWDEASGRFHDGIGADGVPFQTHAIHNQVQAVLCGLHPEAHETIGAEVLHPFLMGTSNETAQPTPFWMTYVYEAARRLGLNDAALQHLAKKWAPMIETGGTWERFDPPGTGNTSGSHAWSAHPLYHLPRIAAGLTPATPGWGRVRFEPPLRFRGCSSVKTTIPTPNGVISASWQRNSRSADVTLDLPQDVVASVVLPGEQAEASTGLSRWSVTLPGISGG
ncbi:MAG: alpha-L-rhamnosidase C-terminal domain-containing protein, partial [Planctomycetota bacterium]